MFNLAIPFGLQFVRQLFECQNGGRFLTALSWCQYVIGKGYKKDRLVLSKSNLDVATSEVIDASYLLSSKAISRPQVTGCRRIRNT